MERGSTPTAVSGPRTGQATRLRRLTAWATARDLAAFVVPSDRLARTLGLDLGAAGLRPVATPRHADVLVLLGELPAGLAVAATVTYAQMPRPRAILAIGGEPATPLPPADVAVALSQPELEAGVKRLRAGFTTGAWNSHTTDFTAPVLAAAEPGDMSAAVDHSSHGHHGMATMTHGGHGGHGATASTAPDEPPEMPTEHAPPAEHGHEGHGGVPAMSQHRGMADATHDADQHGDHAMDHSGHTDHGGHAMDPDSHTDHASHGAMGRDSHTDHRSHGALDHGHQMSHGDHAMMDHGGQMDHGSHGAMEPGAQMEHGDHGAMDQGDQMHHGDHGAMDHSAQMEHGGHAMADLGAQMDHGGHAMIDHGGHAMMGHGDHMMDMDGGFMSMVAMTRDLPRSSDGLPMEWVEAPFGPLFPSLPGGLAVALTLDGDTVARARVTPGAVRRGLEEHWLGPARTFADQVARLDPLAPVAYRALAEEAVERAAGDAKDEATVRGRICARELERAASHLGWLAEFMELLGVASLARRAAATQLALIRVKDTTKLARLRPTVDGLLRDVRRGPLLQRRLSGVARIAPADALSGPVARASGMAADARGEQPAYRALGFSPIVRDGGDALARLQVRLAEVEQSLDLAIAAGELTTTSTALPDQLTGEGMATVETPRGAATLHVTVEQGAVRAAHLQSPSAGLAILVPVVTEGMEVADALVGIGSLDLSPWEMDR